MIQHILPGIDEQGADKGRYALAFHALADFAGDGVARLHQYLFRQTVGLTFFFDETGEFIQQGGKQFRIVLEFVENAVDHVFHHLQGRVFFPGIFRFDVFGTDVSQLVEQLPGRMGFFGEEFLVDNGDFEQRDLQAGDECLDAVGDVRVVENEIEQHADDVDGIGVGLADLTIPAIIHRLVYRLCQAGFDQTGAEGLIAVLLPLRECGLAGELAVALQIGQGADDVLRGVVKGDAASTGFAGGQRLARGDGHAGGRGRPLHGDIATCCQYSIRGYGSGGASERAVLGKHVLQ